MSSGVSTCRWRMESLRFGTYSDSVSTTASPNASRFASSQPPSMSKAAYWTKIDITCRPGGAIPGSIMDGITMSM